jgi:hypothetical protein
MRRSTVIKIYRILPIMVLLRLAPRDCWLVVALGQTEHCQRFCFCSLMRDGRARVCFLINLYVIFSRKGATTVNLENYWGVSLLNETYSFDLLTVAL